VLGHAVGNLLKRLPHQFGMAKSSMAGKSKNGRRNTEGFYNFPGLLRLLLNVKKNVAFQGKRMEIITFLPTAAG
jgi:hypothetical protein